MNDLSHDHERHDELLLAAHAAGDLTGPDADRADALVRACAGCAALATDLWALASAVHDLPAPARSRDFTVTPADAARLRSAGWRRLAIVLRGDRFRLARPIGAGLASLGFAGLVFASTLGGVVPAGGASSAAEAPGALHEVATPSGASTAAGDRNAPAAGPAASPATLDAQQEATGEGRDAEAGQEAPGDRDAGPTAAATKPNEAMIVVSGSLFIVGIGLLGLRWTSDRLGR